MSSRPTSLPYWLHCNYCLKFNNACDTHFHVATCGHIGCDNCAKVRMSPICGKCKKKTSKPRPIEQLPPSHSFLFHDFYETIEEEHRNLQDILTFHRDQWQSQFQHRRRRMQAAKDALTRPEEPRSTSRDREPQTGAARDKAAKQKSYEQAIKNSRSAAVGVKEATERVAAAKKMSIKQLLAKNSSLL
uniref:RING-type domain-containing protein n=1 Tax=Panagrellus redivivus TaxID=6233 RepID=A0A7E4ZYS8_PANRE